LPAILHKAQFEEYTYLKQLIEFISAESGLCIFSFIWKLKM